MKEATGRARVLALKTERVMRLVRAREGVLAGSLYIARTRCGRKACKCMTSDYRHQNWCLSFYQSGKSRTRTVPDELVATVRDLTGKHREVKGLRRGMAKVAREILETVDGVIAKAAEVGQKNLLKSLAEKKGGGT